MDPTQREAPDSILWRLADALKARRELKAKLARIDAAIDADASALTPLVPQDGLNVPVGRDYDRVVVSLQRDRMRGCVATLLPTVRSSDLAWPEAPEPVTPPAPAERTRRVDEITRKLAGASELCTVHDDSDRSC